MMEMAAMTTYSRSVGWKILQKKSPTIKERNTLMPPSTGTGVFCSFRKLGLSVRCFFNDNLMMSGFITMAVTMAINAHITASRTNGISQCIILHLKMQKYKILITMHIMKEFFPNLS